MPFTAEYRNDEPTRDEIDQSAGLLVSEFGADWCGHCRELSPLLADLLDARPDIQHLRIADARGKRLGRSFRVKLWPTFVLLRDGQVVSELVRPSAGELRRALERLEQSSAPGNV